MKKIVIAVSDQKAKAWAGYLADRYGKRSNTSLATLIQLAVVEAVGLQARTELAKIDDYFKEVKE
jgi:hypothetical protein